MITATSARAKASGNHRSNQSDRRRPQIASQEPTVASGLSRWTTGVLCRKYFPFGFRKEKCSDRHGCVRNRSKDANRAAERHSRGKIAHQRWEQCPRCAAEIVREALSH